MIVPNKLNIGDTIGVIAPSDPITEKNIEEINQTKLMLEQKDFKIKYSKNLFSNKYGYSNSAKEKAEDINEMFADKEVKMIWCAKGGENSNTTFEYIDYELIKQNPKILCGYSDITAIANMITQKTGLVTFHGINFKTIATSETDYGYREAIKRFVDKNLEIGENEEYQTIQEGKAEGALIGGNLSLIRALTGGKYKVDFENKILFLEELGLETSPALASNYLSYMKQNDVFNKIRGLWIGYYEHESNISLEQVIMDILGENYKFPIIKSNNFGHLDRNTVIPIGTKAQIDTTKDKKVQLIEECVKG